MTDHEKALKPEDLTRLFVERANNKDAAGIAALYEENAVMAYPPGGQTVGRDAIRALWEKLLPNMPRFEQEEPLPTLVSGDIALTATAPKDEAGARAQVARRQPDGSWLRLLDQPEFTRSRAERRHELAPGQPYPAACPGQPAQGIPQGPPKSGQT
jgi:ketosteroid isomerase-like protein